MKVYLSKIKNYLSLLVLLLIMVTIFSCKENSENEKAKMIGDITIWHYNENAAEMVKKSFNKMNESDLTINIKKVKKTDLKDKILKSIKSNSRDLPDIVALDNEVLSVFLEDEDILMDLEIKDDFNTNTKKMYDYTLKKSKNTKGKVKALALQVEPAAIAYKRDIGRKYLGHSEEESVAEFFSSYENIIETGKKLVNESNGTAKLTTNTDDFFKFYLAERTSSWIENDEVVIDDLMDEFMKLTKRSDELFLDSDIEYGSKDWENALIDDIYFAFPVNFSDLNTIKKIQNNETKYLKRWGIVKHQYRCFDDAVWYGILNESSEKDISWEFIKYITNNEKFLLDYSTGNEKFCNNYDVINKISKDETYISEFTGENLISEFNGAVKKEFIPLETKYDSKINELFIKYSNEYSKNEINYYEHMDEFKNEVNFITGKTEEKTEN